MSQSLPHVISGSAACEIVASMPKCDSAKLWDTLEHQWQGQSSKLYIIISLRDDENHCWGDIKETDLIVYKVWAGKGPCQEVSWQACKLVSLIWNCLKLWVSPKQGRRNEDGLNFYRKLILMFCCIFDYSPKAMNLIKQINKKITKTIGYKLLKHII